MVEWTLGLVIPVIVAGPFCEYDGWHTCDAERADLLGDYIVQGYRFEVIEGLGCENVPERSILTILLVHVWSVIPPLLSVSLYYREQLSTLFRYALI